MEDKFRWLRGDNKRVNRIYVVRNIISWKNVIRNGTCVTPHLSRCYCITIMLIISSRLAVHWRWGWTRSLGSSAQKSQKSFLREKRSRSTCVGAFITFSLQLSWHVWNSLHSIRFRNVNPRSRKYLRVLYYRFPLILPSFRIAARASAFIRSKQAALQLIIILTHYHSAFSFPSPPPPPLY